MKRRLLIARALLNKPKLHHRRRADDRASIPRPATSSGSASASSRAQGVTLILTTQYMEEAQQLCDRLVVMYEGKILKEGVPQRPHRRARSGGRSSRSGSLADDDDAGSSPRLGAARLRPRARRRHALFLLPRRARPAEDAGRARPAQHRPPPRDPRGRVPEADRTEPHRMNLSYRIYHVFVRNLISYKRFVLTTFLVSLDPAALLPHHLRHRHGRLHDRGLRRADLSPLPRPGRDRLLGHDVRPPSNACTARSSR